MSRSIAPFPMCRCIHNLFEDVVDGAPQSVALVSDNGSLTYDQLNRRANQLVRHLLGFGVQPGRAVGLCLDRSVDTIVSLLAILKAGCAYVPLPSTFPRERLEIMAADAEIEFVLTHSRFQSHLPAFAKMICLDASRELIAKEPENNPGLPGSPEDLAYILYTSGSTGQPKGVCIQHRGVIRLVRETDYANFGPEETMMHLAPLAFDLSTFEIWGALLNGARLVLPPPGQPGLDELAKSIRTHRVSTLWLTSGFFNLVVDQHLEALKPLRQLLVGGEALSKSHVERAFRAFPSCRIINGYGPTEATVFACCHTVTEDDFSRPSIPIGRAIANTTVYVVDDDQQPVAPGSEGELLIGGVGLALGYLNDPELTAQRFLQDPFSADPGARLYRSGDRVRCHQDGLIEFIGRLDSQIKIRGHRIEPGEIEVVLQSHSRVSDAVVRVLEPTPGDKRLVAYFVSENSEALDDRSLKIFLQKSLPAYLIPSVFVPLEKLPLTENGKLDRKKLPLPDWSRGGQGMALAAPQSTTEKRLAAIWQELLGISRVSAHDNFFDCGGHSLLAALLSIRIKEIFDRSIAIHEVFKCPILKELAALIDSQNASNHRADFPSLEVAVDQSNYPASHAQQRMWVLQRTLPGEPVFHEPVRLRIRGDLDLAAIQRALCSMERKHPPLRTAFSWDQNRLLARVLPPREFEVPIQDLSDLPPSELELHLSEQIQKEVTRPIDLEVGPIWRQRVFRLAAEDHILILTFHHIGLDEWSLKILQEEFTQAYENEGLENSLITGDPDYSYADYAQWEQKWITTTENNRQLNYWCDQLKSAPVALQLPYDFPRSDNPGAAGATERLTCRHELIGSLKSLAAEMDATFFMTLFAAFETLIFRLSRQEDFIVGTPITHRILPEFQKLTGMIQNTLLIRANVDGSLRIRDLLKRVKSVLVDAFANEGTPIDQIVEAVPAQRKDCSRQPFQVMFTLQNAINREWRLGSLNVSEENVTTNTAKFDFTFFTEETANGLNLILEYRTELFKKSTARLFLEQYAQILAAMVECPDSAISNIPLDDFEPLHSIPERDQSEAEADRLVEPSEALISDVQSVWRDVLNLEQAGVHDNFFEMGGNSLRAADLAFRLERKLNRSVPLQAIFEAPTLSRLVAFLSQQDPEFDRFLKLGPAQPRVGTPLFCISSETLARQFSARLHFPSAVYDIRDDLTAAVEAWGQGRDPGISLEAIARNCLKTIREQQPKGPYRLAGFCFGGVVAFEIARLLHQEGEPVELLALIDAMYAPGLKLLTFPWVKPTSPLFLKRWTYHGYQVLSSGPYYLRKKWHQRRLRKRRTWRHQPIAPDDFLRSLQQSYRGSIYPGAAILFRAASDDLASFFIDPDSDHGWSSMIPNELDIIDLDCDHGGILEDPYITQVADELNRLCGTLNRPGN